MFYSRIMCKLELSSHERNIRHRPARSKFALIPPLMCLDMGHGHEMPFTFIEQKTSPYSRVQIIINIGKG